MLRTIGILFTILFLTAIAWSQSLPAGVPILKYKLIEKFGEPFFCDKDLWPVARAEQPQAQKWFATADLADSEYKAIDAHLKLQKPADHMQPDDILILYREHKKLDSITVEGGGVPFKFSIRTGKFGEQGEAISGTISAAGEITILKKETVENVCPKCLAEGTLIETPEGEVAVQDLRTGMPIWTLGGNGRRVGAEVLSVARVPVPPNHEVLRMRLENGRTLYASSEHPLPDGRSVGQIRANDVLSSIRILSIERVRYGGSYTYDVLPSGATGAYWAEGLLLSTTIAH